MTNKIFIKKRNYVVYCGNFTNYKYYSSDVVGAP